MSLPDDEKLKDDILKVVRKRREVQLSSVLTILNSKRAKKIPENQVRRAIRELIDSGHLGVTADWTLVIRTD